MVEVAIPINKEELNLIKAALTHYRLAGFPLGRSSLANPISQRDRREWAAFGMKAWQKFHEKPKVGVPV